MAPRFPLARGWERQLDIKYNQLFYDRPLNAATYEAWLHQLAVRFVAVPDATLDFSAHQEVALIDRGLPYLQLVVPHQPLARVRGARTRRRSCRAPAHAHRARAQLGDARRATRPGPALVRVRFSPYWKLSRRIRAASQPDGDFTHAELRRPAA